MERVRRARMKVAGETIKPEPTRFHLTIARRLHHRFSASVPREKLLGENWFLPYIRAATLSRSNTYSKEARLMGLLFALLLIVAGILAAAALIIKNQPNARDLIAKLVPFQGIIGIVLLLLGVYWLLFWILPNLGGMMRYYPLTGLVVLLACLVSIGLGFLLGYGLINQYVLSKNADAARSGEAMRLKLAGIQGPVGLIAIVLGIWMLIGSLSWGVF